MIKLEPRAGQAIKTFMSENGLNQSLRLELRFAGCCEVTLGLRTDEITESDLVQEVEGLTFMINREVYELTGDISIACTDDTHDVSFIIIASKPLGEWEGSIRCHIKTK